MKEKERSVPNKYMRERTKGAQRAPIARPYLTLTACGMILRKAESVLGVLRKKDVLAAK